jgi:hypothetical protein
MDGFATAEDYPCVCGTLGVCRTHSRCVQTPVLALLDGSDADVRVTMRACELAECLNADLVLTRAVALPECALRPNVGPYLAAYYSDAVIADAEEYLEGVAARLDVDFDVSIRAEAGEPVDVVRRLASVGLADWVVMAGGFAGDRLRDVPVPVMLVQDFGPKAAARQGSHSETWPVMISPMISSQS